jgi:hypothetical protein
MVLVLAPELVLERELELVLVQGLVRELVLALGRHKQLGSRLTTMPAESTTFSFSLIYFLLRFCNLAVY